ncbi:MAG: cadherin-like domain-containing protein, partial [Coriobacteriia bacterium]|nr:cadherin-like domain-containing protein [Coriobacteriia bacterium]
MGTRRLWEMLGSGTRGRGALRLGRMAVLVAVVLAIVLCVTPAFAEPPQYSVDYTADMGGSISGEAHQLVYEAGSASEVIAVPDPGYLFVSWSDGHLEASRLDTNVTANLSFSASFEPEGEEPPPTYTLTYSAGDNGSILGDSPQYVDEGMDGGEVLAVPSFGYYFVDWSDSLTDNPRTDFSVYGDVNVVANFALDTTYPTVELSGVKRDGRYLVGVGHQAQLTASDNSGISAIDYRLSTDETTTTVNADTASIDLPITPGVYTYLYTATDNNGHVTGGRFTITMFELAAPAVESSTHPVANNYYANSNPVLSWPISPFATGYSWQLESTYEIDPIDSTIESLSVDMGTQRLLNDDAVNPHDTVAADFNGDGHLDLATAEYYGYGYQQYVHVALYDEATDGYTASATRYPTPTSYYGVSSVATADFNGDGFADLVAAMSDPTGRVSILMNNGDGTFGAGIDLLIPSVTYIQDVECGDMNDDGIVDIVAGASYPWSKNVAVLIGNGADGVGDGTFAAPAMYWTSGDTWFLKLADVNADDALDIITSAYNETAETEKERLSVLVNEGDGTFPDYENSAAVPYFPIGADIGRADTGDFNSDGILDVVVGNGANYPTGRVSLLLGTGGGYLADPVQLPFTFGAARQLLVSDVNKDGKDDVVIADSNFTLLRTLYGQGDGSFEETSTSYGASHYFSYLGDVADLNNDGVDEILACGTAVEAYYPSLSVRLGPLADGGYYLRARAVSTPESAAGPTASRLIRIDTSDPNVSISGVTDGATYEASAVPDAVLTADGTFSGVAGLYYRVVGASEWTTATGYEATIDIPATTGWHHYEFRAVDEAGNESEGSFRVGVLGAVTGLSSPTHPVESTWYKNNAPGFLWAPMETASGYSWLLDQVAEQPDLDTVADGMNVDFLGPRAVSEGIAYSDVAVGDFNHDGTRDLASTRYDRPCSVDIAYGNGDGTYQAPVTIQTPNPDSGYYAEKVAVGDFNADGWDDLAISQNDWNGRVSVLLNQQDGTFAGTDYATNGAYASGIVTGDVNDDGVLDLVVANSQYWDRNVAVFIGNETDGVADGTFQAAVTYWTRFSSVSPKLVDMNNDGSLDIVTANIDDNTVSVLLNEGDGTYPVVGGPNASLAFEAGQRPEVITVADFTGDGNLDVVAGSSGYSTMHLLVGDGDGNLGTPTLIGGGANSLATDDLNADGWPDLIVVDQVNMRVQLWINDAGTLNASDAYGIISSGGTTRIAIADLDGDQLDDLAYASANGVEILKRDLPVKYSDLSDGLYYFHLRALGADGTASDVVTREVRIDANAPNVAVTGATNGALYQPGEVTQLDVAMHDFGSGVQSLKWKRSTDSTWTVPETEEFSIPVPTDAGYYRYIFKAKDLSGNASSSEMRFTIGAAITDLASGSHPDPATWYSNSYPTFSWTNGVGAPGTAFNVDASATADAAGTTAGMTWATFQPAMTAGGSTSSRELKLGDIDGDSLLDLVAVDAYNNCLTVQIGAGDGTFGESVVYAMPEKTQPADDGPNGLVIEDFNGDGANDIAVADNFKIGQALVLLNNGDGTLADPVSYATGGEYPQKIVAADFNGDAVNDLAITHGGYDYSGMGVGVLLGNADGTFDAARLFPWNTAKYGELGLGDFNRDGNIDLVASRMGEPYLTFGYGDGNGDFSYIDNMYINAESFGLATGDMNGDGYTDVASVDTAGGAVQRLFSAGNGGYNTDTSYGFATPGSLALTDFNGDGTLDLIVMEAGMGRCSVTPGYGNAYFAGLSTYYFGGDLSKIATGDTNEDGLTDFVTVDSLEGAKVIRGYGSYTPDNNWYDDGVWFLHTRSVGTDGTTGDTASLEFRIDTNAPQFTVSGIADDGAYIAGSTPTATVSVTDAASGVLPGSAWYQIDPFDSTHHDPDTEPTITMPTEPGTYSLSWHAEDLAGNTVDGSLSFTLVGGVEGLNSPTHPDPEAWYNNDTAGFDWTKLNTVGYSYLLDQDPNTVPDLTDEIKPTVGAGLLNSWRSYDTEYDSEYVATGDLNEDGHPDMVTSDRWDACITIRFNDGTGGFDGGSSTLDVGSEPSGIAIADFTGDGHVDIAVANYDDYTISILTGDGAGDFTMLNTFETVAEPWEIAAGDIDQDGNIDLAVSSFSNSEFKIEFGDGTGAFPDGEYWGTDESGEGGIKLSDLDRDGDLDVVYATYNSATIAYAEIYEPGDVSFSNQAVVYTDAYPEGSVAVGDFNEDGHDDIVLPDESDGYMSVIFADDGDFFESRQITLDQISCCEYGAATGDINDDGHLDIVSVNEDEGTFSVWVGDGEGDFADREDFYAYLLGYGVATADFNGDGHDDVCAGDDENGVAVMFGGDAASPAALTLSDPVIYPTGSGPRTVVSADFDEDGSPDLATADANSAQLTIQLNNGDGTFATHATHPTTGTTPRGIVSADFNGDTHADLAVSNYDSGSIGLFLGNGDGTFQDQVEFGGLNLPDGLTVGDFNNDNLPDLATVSDGGNYAYFQVLYNDGEGGFGTHETVYANDGASDYLLYGSIAAGDWDGDGSDEIVVNTQYGICMAGNDEGWSLAFEDTYNNPSGGSVKVADFNDDGSPDIAIAGGGNSSLKIKLNTNDGSWNETWYNMPQYYNYGITVGDANGDGALDIVTTDDDNRGVSLFINDGSGYFYGNPEFHAVSSLGWGVTAADFNDDGCDDVAFTTEAYDPDLGWQGKLGVMFGSKPPSAAQFGPLADGTYYFHIRPTAAGFGGPTSTMQVNIDTAVPTVEMSGVTDGETYTSNQQATITGADSGSGVDRIEWRDVDGPDWTSVAGDTATIDFVTADPGTFTCEYVAYDRAGNVSETGRFTVTVQSSGARVEFGASEGGSLEGTTSQLVEYGSSTTTVTANPAVGHHFVDWTGTGGFETTTTNPLVFGPVSADVTITANFAPDTRTLTYLAGEGGSIEGSAAQTVDYGTDGTEVLAVAASGYRFVEWSDTGTSSNRTDANVTENATYTATFREFAAHPDTFTVSANETNTIAASGVLANDVNVASAELVSGASHGDVTLEADGSFTYVPDANYTGADSFVYRGSDGGEDRTEPAVVTLLVSRTLETIEGTITAGGIGLNHIVVTAFDASTDAWEASVFTDANGHYTMRVLNGYHHIRFTRAADGVLAEGLEQYYQHVKKIVDAQVVRNHVGERLVLSDDLTPLVD